jgi:calcium-dependent protein kinase, putative
MLYLLLMGYPPYVNETMESIMEEAVHGEVLFVEEDWSHVSENAMVLVRQMLEKDPKKRISMERVMASPWLISSRVEICVVIQS